MKKTRMSSVAVFSTLAFLLSAQSAWTAGLLRLESEGFLRTSENRDTSNYMLTFGPQFEDQGKVLAGKVDIKAISYLKNPDALTIESKNAYMATSPELLGMNQFTIGRREYDWSTMDDVWKFGMWTPRFTWDPLKPEQIGLTGAFYTHESSVWRVLVYSSPVSIPERSYPVRNSEGKVYSDSPYSIPLPEKVVMLKNQVDINYNIQDPQYSEILSRPAGAVQLRYGRKDQHGGWGSIGYGYMPIHQIDLAVDASLNTQTTVPRMEANIYPRFPMHHIATSEGGYKGKNWNAWASVSGDQPQYVDTSQNWIYNKTGPAIISSAGAGLQWQQSLNLHASYLFVVEKNHGVAGPASVGALDLDLPQRFPFRRAFQLGGHWDRGSPTTYGAKWTNDSENQSNLVSVELNYSPRWRTKIYQYESWKFGIGTDFIASSTGKGTIGKYRGDDRVRGGVTYAF